ncbi:MAG: hypothetical protein JXJ20_10145 [Anaerolineae bacterium]|nr:hypothetical protein [Anaerolineae bacterium]
MNLHPLWRVSLIAALALVGLGLAAHSPAAAQDGPIRIIFMHHSTGEALIWEGGVREAFTALGYEFWDHGYNSDGLVDASGTYLNTNWDMPDDNTDPDGWYTIFNQEVTDPPDNTLSHMLEYDVIIFKSCFPASDIYDEEMFEAYRSYFLDMRDVMDQHPDKLFIPFTTPPLVPDSTSPDAAARARRWAEYLTSDEYLDGHPNIAVFDFFNQLADDDGYLSAEYRVDEYDSHPNELANRTVGPVFVSFVDQAIRAFASGEPIQPVEQPDESTEPEEAEETEETEPVEQPDDSGPPDTTAPDQAQAANILEDFESGAIEDIWWLYTNDGVTAFTCEAAGPGYNSDYALRLTFDIQPDGSAGCGADTADIQAGGNWADADGIGFYLWADQDNTTLRFGLGVYDPTQQNPDVEDATPFDIELHTTGGTWSYVTILWDDLTKVEWVGDTGIEVFDPTKVIWLVFDIGDWQYAQQGAIWIDDVHLITGD